VTGQALAAQHLARVSWLAAEYDEAERWAQESQGWYEQTGDRQGLIAARNELGIVAAHRREVRPAQALLGTNLVQAREIGDRFREAQALNSLGEVNREQGSHEEARAYYEQCQMIAEEIGDRRQVATALANLGMVCLAQGQDEAAWRHFRQALQEDTAIQDVPHVVNDLVWMAHLRSRAGQPERAAELLGLALRHPASYSEVDRDAQPVLEALREAFGPEELDAALARGAEMELEQVVAQILAGEG